MERAHFGYPYSAVFTVTHGDGNELMEHILMGKNRLSRSGNAFLHYFFSLWAVLEDYALMTRTFIFASESMRRDAFINEGGTYFCTLQT